ncbi:MAG: permease-like cell division protein FtsX [Caldisericia bacterium]|nr:permease-like cell division protein FtsX [Caldisericia bacterium]
MKSFLVLIREIKEAFINIKRAGFLTFITILVITISLYSIGMIYFFYLYSNRVREGIENRIEVSFYLEKNVTEERIEEIRREISLLPEVENVRYISPEESLEELKKEYPEYASLFSDLKENPLPPTFFVKPRSIFSIKLLTEKVNEIPEIKGFFYSKELVDKLIFSIKTFSILSLIIVFIFIGIFVFFIGVNINLSIFNRREDIEIMKLLGVHPNFIKIPFIIEGIVLSLISGVISSFLLYKSYIEVSSLLNMVLPFIKVNFYDLRGFNPYILVNIIGLITSITVSFFILRKYLKEVYP